MKRILIIVTIIILGIVLDTGSKLYVEKSLAEDYCIHMNPDPVSQGFGGYFPSMDCSPLSDETLLSRYQNILKTEGIPIIGEYLRIRLSYNPGIAFSLPIKGLPLQILTVLALIGIIWFYIREEYPKSSKILDTGYALILAGALSHAYERIFVGHVVDFIAVKYFAILNFADIFISVGAFLIILTYVRTRQSR